ncbi:hypothetical protein [Umezawaea beigongshangensis]|uniref:hypothetical protein n=1 Tax=Umezawaea beigongshangensis TaxID=2780383 RepID=UPI0018F21198|nr:hypothetical protein [Umezawaea beigongshangensis]
MTTPEDRRPTNSASGRIEKVVQSGTIDQVHVGDRHQVNHDRRGIAALSGVVVLLLALLAWVLASRESPPAGEEPADEEPLAAITALLPKNDCVSGWVVPEVLDGPVDRTDERPAGGVLATGGEVRVTVQGLTGDSVVLQSARVEVVARRPAMTGTFLASGCESGVAPRFFRVDLTDPAPALVPWTEGEPGADDEPLKDFPYKISDVDPEQFVITPFSPVEDVEWRLHLSWTSGDRRGDLVVDDDGRPLRTTATTAARHFCVDGTSLLRWVPEEESPRC